MFLILDVYSELFSGLVSISGAKLPRSPWTVISGRTQLPLPFIYVELILKILMFCSCVTGLKVLIVACLLFFMYFNLCFVGGSKIEFSVLEKKNSCNLCVFLCWFKLYCVYWLWLLLVLSNWDYIALSWLYHYVPWYRRRIMKTFRYFCVYYVKAFQYFCLRNGCLQLEFILVEGNYM